jgi:prepilin-type N-terminal cleavage/methylation domain-containing protein
MSEKRHSFRAGFTLIEILTVVVILAILAALALPAVLSQDDLIASAAARMVVSDLLYAQSQAIATQTMQSVSFTAASGETNGSWGGYSISPLMVTRSFGTGAPGGMANTALLSVTLGGSASNTLLQFDTLGQPCVGTPPSPLASSGSIVLQCGSMQVTISIEPCTGNLSCSLNTGSN